MAIPAIGLAAAAAQALPQVAGAAGGGGGFDAALKAATGGGGGSDQLVDKMVETGAQVMGGIMMRLAGDILNEGMADDDEG